MLGSFLNPANPGHGGSGQDDTYDSAGLGSPTGGQPKRQLRPKSWRSLVLANQLCDKAQESKVKKGYSTCDTINSDDKHSTIDS